MNSRSFILFFTNILSIRRAFGRIGEGLGGISRRGSSERVFKMCPHLLSMHSRKRMRRARKQCRQESKAIDFTLARARPRAVVHGGGRGEARPRERRRRAARRGARPIYGIRAGSTPFENCAALFEGSGPAADPQACVRATSFGRIQWTLGPLYPTSHLALHYSWQLSFRH